MANVYLSFLNSPKASALAPNASLHYITTTTSIHDADAIIKHFQAQEKLVKKKSETILSSIATNDAVVVESETELEFVRGGGAFLPNMDDNMLIDSLVTVPIVSSDAAALMILCSPKAFRSTSCNSMRAARSARSACTGTSPPCSGRSTQLAERAAIGPSVMARP